MAVSQYLISKIIVGETVKGAELIRRIKITRDNAGEVK